MILDQSLHFSELSCGFTSMMKVLDFALFVMVHVWIGKEFPDMRKDERRNSSEWEMLFRTERWLQGEPTRNMGHLLVFIAREQKNGVEIL